MFITFEGPEGCGKSTHSKRLKTYLENKGHRVVLTQEPGGTLMGKRFRELLLHPESVLNKTSEIFLFAADRSEHVSKIIRPALFERKIVISDRFTDSTIAYQIGGRGLPEDMVRYINEVSSKGLVPDLTLLLDVSPETGIKRATQNGSVDRFEGEKIDFHQRVREKYLEIARNHPKRIKVVNTDGRGIDEIQDEIRKIVGAAVG
jgi:dTMP kinase